MAAGKAWDVEPGSIQTANGMLSADGNEISYIDLINDTAQWEMPEETPELRPRDSFKVVGTEQLRSDLKPKVMGEPIFALDYELPDMLHANLLKCPYIGGTLDEMDVEAAKAFPGVLDVIQEEVGGDEMIAVVAENRWAAEMGKRALNAQWNMPKEWQQGEIDKMTTVGSDGVSPVSLQLEGRASHRAFIITGSQAAAFHKGAIAAAIGIEAENIDIQNAYLGGGFGRRVGMNPSPEAAVCGIGRPSFSVGYSAHPPTTRSARKSKVLAR